MTDPDDEDRIDEILRHVDPKAGLDALSPATARERYLDHRRSEVTETTLQEYADRLDEVVEFCDRRDVEHVKDLDGAAVADLVRWIREEVPEEVDEYGPKTMRDYAYLLRSFLRYLESVDAVREGLHESVAVPDLAPGDGVDEELLDADRARDVLAHLSRFEYATAEHVVWVLLTETGCRRGGVRSLDLGDCYLDGDRPYLEFFHRPEEGTRLKNGFESEREVAIAESTAAVLRDYVEHNRVEVTDEYGREPLLTTSQGRLSKSSITKYAYKWSRPCAISDGCPHGRDVGVCEAASDLDAASQCPSSRSPHRVRKGYMSDLSKKGVPKEVLSDRCDVSVAVLEKHYEFVSESEKREMRREVLEEVREGRGYTE